MERFTIIDWGAIPYEEAYNKQKSLFDKSVAEKNEGKQPDNYLILCEHPHVITVGKNGLHSNLLFPEKLLNEKNVSLVQTDRGGDITYHGPGQLVVYPIFDLDSFHLGLKDYIHLLEEIIIQLLQSYNIHSERMDRATGVWLETQTSQARKICAIGVKSSKYVTMHGLALNIHTDLSYFQLINPCGFTDKGVTSIEKELQTAIDIKVLKEKLIDLFSTHFNTR